MQVIIFDAARPGGIPFIGALQQSAKPHQIHTEARILTGSRPRTNPRHVYLLPIRLVPSLALFVTQPRIQMSFKGTIMLHRIITAAVLGCATCSGAANAAMHADANRRTSPASAPADAPIIADAAPRIAFDIAAPVPHGELALAQPAPTRSTADDTPAQPDGDAPPSAATVSSWRALA
ncbi:hypothetical protein G3580_07340 [Nitrogeniibacter mangrovi]|uniref:Uncharacterized protein n=1 Tax=Nitrogeniibacter mangrovi TaxID=2016596 RepID=A0A6C1B275_9RHOO|nr:hypothetical protein [Nitrogeniibacter mangrovi]QID17473.1 hypothetical protein G3580_07340 [Nitrogeniibacter mangrovi]